MLPRKRSRPNPTVTTPSSVKDVNLVSAAAPPRPEAPGNPSTSPPASQESHSHQMPPPSSANTSQSSFSSNKPVRKAQTWYGSWPRTPKASASTSVARENILGGSIPSQKTPDFSRYHNRRESETSNLHNTARTTSGLSKPPGDGMAGTETGPDGKVDSQQTSHQGNGSFQINTDMKKTFFEDNATQNNTIQKNTTQETSKQGNDAPPTEPNTTDANHSTGGQDETTETTPPTPATYSSWLGWWSKRPANTGTQAASTPHSTSESSPELAKQPMIENGRNKQPQSTIENETDKHQQPTTVNAPKQDETTLSSTASAQTAASGSTAPEQPQGRPTTWFGFWPSGTQTGNLPTTNENEPVIGQLGQTEPAKDTEDVAMQDAPSVVPEQKPQTPKAGSTWAFWSKDSPKPKGTKPERESGEIAVIGEGSEAHPKPMVEEEVSASPSKPPKAAKDTPGITRSLTWRRSNKRIRPASMDIEPPSPSLSGTSTPAEANQPQPNVQPSTTTKTKVDSPNKSIVESESSIKLPPNLLLPSFSSTYTMKENPSMLKQVTSLLLRTERRPINHVFRLKEPPKIRKAIAIGVHGLFPATYLRPMIGQPTGTSLRFASLCAEAIRRWTEAHGCSDCEIEKVALEGEGKINERVDNLWTLMLNWLEHIRSADLVLIACHSQGVPVSIMLLEKLINLGIITNARIGVCAMAGVALGPFPEYKSSIFMGSAAELWEFGNPQSQNSLRFEAALKRVLDYGARITFIGSIDDQVVPVESAVYSPANHPYIYRAVFIDGRVHAPDFIAHLVGFALKLRNLGISDHGLIRELSLPLAGSLYSGEGHSRLYFDSAVYDLAVSHCLETTSVPQPVPPCVVQPRDGSLAGGGQTNPYVLPWIMRGMLEEDFVKTAMGSEVEELLKQFDYWKPINKALKDVKYRLEAVRSKL